MAFGHIEGYPPGSLFESRAELSDAKVHRPPQAGICGGKSSGGAESIVLSGGYEDDFDLGAEILYTGQGGRDPASGEQVAPQPLSHGNIGLAISMQRGLPVRVIRGAHPEVHDAPESGYRYDGLYRVVDYWAESGRSGYRVWRFRLVPYEEAKPSLIREEQEPYEPAPRREERVQRVVRSTAVAESVKRLHEYRCQVCGERLDTAAGPYAEAAHIRPLGRPHDGPDVPENVLCLCPNHHVLFDHFRFTVADDLFLIGLPGELRTHKRHPLDPTHLDYHRSLFFAAHDDA